MSLALSHSRIGDDLAVITVSGRLMMGPEGERIPELAERLLAEGVRRFVFDLSGITSIDSTGIGRFIYCYNKIAEKNGEMRMAGATGHVFEAFHVSLLDTVFRFDPSVEEALKN
jgi:anti-sigma B factor antagonist